MKIIAIALMTALCLPGAAMARKPKPRQATFLLTLEAHREANWTVPQQSRTLEGPPRCLDWQVGHGKETWDIKSRKPAKVVARSSNGSVTLSLTESQPTPYGTVKALVASGKTTREGEYRQWSTGGTFCDAPVAESDHSGCGTRLPEHLVQPVVPNKGRINLRFLPSSQDVRFGPCPFLWADGYGDAVWPEHTTKLPVGALFDKKKKEIEIKGGIPWNERVDTPAGWGVGEASGKIDWTLKLKRVK
jgi:hypothetical protein